MINEVVKFTRVGKGNLALEFELIIEKTNLTTQQ